MDCFVQNKAKLYNYVWSVEITKITHRLVILKKRWPDANRRLFAILVIASDEKVD